LKPKNTLNVRVKDILFFSEPLGISMLNLEAMNGTVLKSTWTIDGSYEKLKLKLLSNGVLIKEETLRHEDVKSYYLFYSLSPGKAYDLQVFTKTGEESSEKKISKKVNTSNLFAER